MIFRRRNSLSDSSRVPLVERVTLNLSLIQAACQAIERRGIKAVGLYQLEGSPLEIKRLSDLFMSRLYQMVWVDRLSQC